MFQMSHISDLSCCCICIFYEVSFFLESKILLEVYERSLNVHQDNICLIWEAIKLYSSTWLICWREITSYEDIAA